MDNTFLTNQAVTSQEGNSLSFNLSKKAAERIRLLQEMEEKESGISGKMLRILVYSGGCSGFKYHLEMTNESEDGDVVIADDLGKSLAVIDQITLEMINGGTLDFVDEISGSYFRVKNPNAKTSCGCGNSFS